MKSLLIVTICFFASVGFTNPESGRRIKRISQQINSMAQNFKNYDNLTRSENREIHESLLDLRSLMRSVGMRPAPQRPSIEVIWGGPGNNIQAINPQGKKILPSGWKATNYKTSNTIIALTLNKHFYSRDINGKQITPNNWKADWYDVNDHFVVLRLGDYIYAYNNQGKRVIRDGWKGKNISFSGRDGERIRFEWNGRVHVIDKNGNDLGN